MGVLGIALGYTEAAVVVYLREMLVPLRQVHLPQYVREVVPLLTIEQLREAGEQYPKLLITEVCREVAPLVVLLCAAWSLRRGKRDVLAFFLLGFGIWDIFYYVFLKLLLGWPTSLATWDVLYLIPTAWVAPVWGPLLVSVTMIAVGLAILNRRSQPRRGRRGIIPLCLIGLAITLILTSFFMRTKEAFGAIPPRFDWEVFLVGWIIGVIGVVWMFRGGSAPAHR